MSSTKPSCEQLLKPRYKVIADYPGSNYDVGDIYSDLLDATGWKEWSEKYPHLFQPLPWWEEREVDEMPEYVKWIYRDKNSVHETRNWKIMDGVISFECYNLEPKKRGTGWTVVCHWLNEFAPATKAEYLEYNKNKQI